MNVRYDIQLEKLRCGHCGSTYAPEEFDDRSAVFDALSCTCQSCGAKLITADDTEATAFCSYCGSASILTGRIENIKKPDAILPFRYTREACRKIYLDRARHAFLAPRWLKSEECVNSFRPIYMPYWSYRIHASGYLSGSSVRTDRDGDYINETTYSYKSENFDRDTAVWSHDASKAFADDISETIRFDMFDKSQLKPFHEAYLSGFYADMAEEVAERHKQSAMLAAEAQMGKYAGKRFTGSITMSEHKLYYLPVWFMSTRRGGKVTYAAVNGYNGAIVADFPVSSKGFFLLALAAAVLLAALLSMVLVLRPEPAYWISALLTAIGLFFCGKTSKSQLDAIEATGQSGTKAGPYTSGGIPVRIVYSIILLIFGALLLFTRNNAVIYSLSALNAAILSYNCLRVFRIHQDIAYRRPPQFDRRGSEYDA